MEEMEDEDFDLSVALETEKSVVFMELTLIITIEWDLSTLSSRPAQVRTVAQQETKVWAPETVEDIRLRSSLKVSIKGNLVFLVMNLGTLTCKEYSYMMLITLKKIII